MASTPTTVTFRFLAMRLACDTCGQQARIDVDLCDDLSESASAWWVEHRSPNLVAVEATANGVEHEWEIAGKRRERLLYVSPQGVSEVHAEIDQLIDEWREAAP